MTALIVAVKGGYTEVVKELLKRNPNINMTDKDGNTALMIAAKEGYTEIVQDLLDAGTYVNIPDRVRQRPLKPECFCILVMSPVLQKPRGPNSSLCVTERGHGSDRSGFLVPQPRAKAAETLHVTDDALLRFQENKTALYWAVEKGNATMVRDILQCNPDTETCTKKGDTPLHIAIRSRSRRLAELLLRNPKDGRLLYRPNKAGETPYNIDCSHQKSILTQIFGAQTDGDMLGYDLYSSALADILSEPTMQPPICVGLYAQWGNEMKTFARQEIEPLFQFSWLIVFLSLLFCGSVAIVLGFTVDPKLAMAVSLSLLALLYLFFVVVYFGGRREGDNWTWAWLISTRLARHIRYLELLLKLMFVNPPELPEQSTRALPVRFLFTDYNRLSSVGGETSMAEMIATLSDACEREFGFLAARLFRVFKTEETPGKKKWKKTCCVPSFILFIFVLVCLITGMALLAVFKVDSENQTVNAVLIAIGSVVGLAVLLNCRTWWQVTDSVLNSQRKRLHGAANRMHKLKSEGFMKVRRTFKGAFQRMMKLFPNIWPPVQIPDGPPKTFSGFILQVMKHEVELMARMAKTIDGFTQHQTRLVVVIDGLDSCEQDKVLQMLDTVRVLFSKGPFISIFASDPHIIIKAINQNLNSVLRDSNINGHDYMRNIVHLPDTYRRRQVQRSVTRQMSFDLTKLMVTEDWFSDISPQTMRRLLNIVSVTGRLLRANQISFNWDRLASWINLTEQWPYRTSWLILYLEETDGVPDQATLKSIYERVSKNIPTTKDVEPLLEIDGDIRSFEVFLSSRSPILTARDIRTFLPCTVNLDPKLREIIAGQTQNSLTDTRTRDLLTQECFPSEPDVPSFDLRCWLH
ncbi:hypothetical protein XENOCAPTIV_030906 [Xenoophorus captivus]|uniref:KAP NTPase domain-containing protein n=1 Tax=Xenoophorus captivus TaxID=1517983 RepID=A0ABV0QXI5_9TELE